MFPVVELLNKIDFRPAADHLVLTGDIIAKGPDSPALSTLLAMCTHLVSAATTRTACCSLAKP